MNIGNAIKKSFKKTALISLLAFPFFLVMVKFGFRKWRAASEPITWEEFFDSLPKHIAIYFAGCIVLFVVFFLYSSKGANDLYICVNCDSVVRKWEIDKHSGKCPFCGANTEPLEGFYERHPDRKT